MKVKRGMVLKMLIIAVVIQMLLMAGCNSPATPAAPVVPVTGGEEKVSTEIMASPTKVPATATPEEIAKNKVVNLADGSKVIVMPGSDFEIIAQSDSKEIQLKLTKGNILVVPNASSGKLITVTNGKYMARISGCGMAVIADPAENKFGLNCVGGKCELGTDSAHLQKVNSLEGVFYQNNIVQKPAVIDLKQLKEMFGDNLPDCGVIPVTGGEANVDATASCQDFQSKFPGTPCP